MSIQKTRSMLEILQRISFLFFIFTLVNSCATGSALSANGDGEVVTVNTGDGNVSFDQNFIITFSAAVDIDTVTSESFFIVLGESSTSISASLSSESLCDLDLAIEATITCSTNTSCELTPTLPLQTGTTYNLCLTSNIHFLNPQIYGVFTGYEVSFTTNDAVLESLALSPSTVSLDVEDTQQYTVTGTYDDDTTQTITSGLTWSSSDDNIVSVDQSGVATALALGEATISVTQSSTDLTASATASVDFPVGGVFRYTVGGTIDGLSGTLVLQVNGGDNLSVIANGDFTFDTSIANGESYNVTVLTQPASQTCVVTGGSTLDGGAISNVSVTCTNNTKIIFVAATDGDGFHGDLDGQTGVAGADVLCNADSNKPNGSTYKAMIVDGSVRVACTTANCGTGGNDEHVDWVLSANTTYVRVDGTTEIGTTNSIGLFTDPLTNSIKSGGGVVCWTGLTNTWVTSIYTCVAWTSTATTFGGFGFSSQTDTRAWGDDADSCIFGANDSLYCVEQ